MSDFDDDGEYERHLNQDIYDLKSDRDLAEADVKRLTDENAMLRLHIREWHCDKCREVLPPETVLKTDFAIPRCPKCDGYVSASTPQERMLRERANAWVEAFGTVSAIAEDMEIDAEDPAGMAQKICEYAAMLRERADSATERNLQLLARCHEAEGPIGDRHREVIANLNEIQSRQSIIMEGLRATIRDLTAEVERIREGERGLRLGIAELAKHNSALNSEIERLERRRAVLCPLCDGGKKPYPVVFCPRCGDDGAVIVDDHYTPDGRYICEHCGGSGNGSLEYGSDPTDPPMVDACKHCGGTGDVRNATGGGEGGGRESPNNC